MVAGREGMSIDMKRRAIIQPKASRATVSTSPIIDPISMKSPTISR